MTSIRFLFSIFIVFVFRAASVARLAISGTLFSISMTFSLKAVVVTKPIARKYFVFNFCTFIFKSVLNRPLVLGILLLTSSIFF